MPKHQPPNLVVLISGTGSNLQAIIDAVAQGGIPARLCAVISNRADALGLDKARSAHIPTQTLDHKAFADRQQFDQALMAVVDSYQPDIVALAGFMRILTPEFVRHYRGRLINIHPSLLPAFTGLNTHQRALDAGAAEHGASVHFVTEDLDMGPVIIQARVPVQGNDNAKSLAERVLEQEHRIYPQAIAWLAEGRLTLQDHQALLDGKPIKP